MEGKVGGPDGRGNCEPRQTTNFGREGSCPTLAARRGKGYDCRVPFPRLRLPASGWKRWLALIGLSIGLPIGLLFLLILAVVLALQVPAVQQWVYEKSLQWDAPTAEQLSKEIAGQPSYTGPVGEGKDVRTAADVFRPDRFWNVELAFTRPEWDAIQFDRVESVKDWMSSPHGEVKLRNPAASRNGLSGVLGFDLPWSTGRVSLGGVVFTNVGVRFKGNGTFLESLRSYRKPFKVHLTKNQKGATFAGRTQFNLGNLAADLTCLSDTLGYEFHREAGVPSPRTGFSRVFLSIEGVETNRLLGLYLMVENPDGEWAREQFTNAPVALFKPVTYELFSDLGTNWAEYDGIYDPKTSVTAEEKARVMEVAHWVTHATDDEFAAGLADRFEVPEIARFLACEVLLSNYDGIQSNGQNFLMYLDSRTQRFGFIPWDLDHSWGEFPFIGTAREREQASIWQPWVGRNRLLDRMFQVESFRAEYRKELERLLTTQLVPERLNRRIDELAAPLRPVISEWSTNRLAKFEIAVSDTWSEEVRETSPNDPNRPVWQLKRFIANRSRNVRQQLDGQVEGVVIQRQKHF